MLNFECLEEEELLQNLIQGDSFYTVLWSFALLSVIILKNV